MEADVINDVAKSKKDVACIQEKVKTDGFVGNVYACVKLLTNKSTVSTLLNVFTRGCNFNTSRSAFFVQPA